MNMWEEEEEEAPKGRNCCVVSASPGRSSKAGVGLLFRFVPACFYGRTSIIRSILMMTVIRQQACGHDLDAPKQLGNGRKRRRRKKEDGRSEEAD